MAERIGPSESLLAARLNAVATCGIPVRAADVMATRRKQIGPVGGRHIVVSLSMIDHDDHVHYVLYRAVRTAEAAWELDSLRSTSQSRAEPLRPLILDRSAVGSFTICGVDTDGSIVRISSADGGADTDVGRDGLFLVAIERLGPVELPVSIEIQRQGRVIRGSYPGSPPWPATDRGHSRRSR